MSISKISCTPISPKSVSFGTTDKKASAPVPMSEDEQIASMNDMYHHVKDKQPKSKAGKVLGNIAAIGLTGASFAIVGSKVLKRLITDEKAVTILNKIKDSLASEAGIKYTTKFKNMLGGLSAKLEGKKLQKFAKSLESGFGGFIDKLSNLKSEDFVKGLKVSSKVAGAAAGVATAVQDKDGDGQSDIKEKTEGALKAVGIVGDALLAVDGVAQ